jgi:hypothetical protein
MTHNPFRPILVEKSFTQGVSGLWFSPDTKYCDGCVVELVGPNAVAAWKGGRTLFEATSHTDLEKFLEEVA